VSPKELELGRQVWQEPRMCGHLPLRPVWEVLRTELQARGEASSRWPFLQLRLTGPSHSTFPPQVCCRRPAASAK